MKRGKIVLTLLLIMSLFLIAPSASEVVSAEDDCPSSHWNVHGLNDKSEEIKLNASPDTTITLTFSDGKKLEKTLLKKDDSHCNSLISLDFSIPNDVKPLLVYGESVKIEYKRGNSVVKTETSTVKHGIISPKDVDYSDRVISGVGHPGKQVVLFTTVVTPGDNVESLETKVLKVDETGRWMYKYTDEESKKFNELTTFQVLSDSSSLSGDEESSKSNPVAVVIKEGRVNPIAVGERYIAGAMAYLNMEGWTKSIEMSVTFPNGRTVKRAFESIPYKQRGKLNNEWSIEIPKDIVLKPQDKVKVELFSKWLDKPQTTIVTVGGEASKTPTVNYLAHVQDSGWQSYVKDGELAGTLGRGLRVEAFRMNLTNLPMPGGIQYATHVQNIGWQDAVSDNQISGTTGKGLRTEAVKISLTGEIAKYYDVYYRAHVQNYGWLDWARNGEETGTLGKGLRMEAIEVKLVKKGYPAPTSNGGLACLDFISPPKVYYAARVQKDGWQDTFGNGNLAGTVGKGLRVEAMKMALYEHEPEPSSNISYEAHVENIGWQSPVTKWGTAGIEGSGLRIEAIRVNLLGALAKYYDVYYRTHIQNYGWLGWAKNGQNAGSEGKSLRMEAFEVKLVAKGDSALEPEASYV